MQNDAITGFRLSPWQAQLWADQHGEQPYVSRCVVRINGPLDPQALRSALGAVVGRHEVLRTNFRRRTGMKAPLQVIGDIAALDWREADTGESFPDGGAAAVRDDGDRPLDFEGGPPMRAVLRKLSDQRYALTFTVPTLCADAKSLEIIARDLAAAYAGGGQFSTAEEPPLQYADFSEWQNQLFEADDEETRSGKAFWARPDLDAPPITLPFQGPADPGTPFAEGRVSASVDGDVLHRVEALAKREGATLSDALLACWQALVARLTGEADVVVRVASEGRKQQELKDAVGLFAQALPLPCRVENHSFLELVRQAHQAVEDAARWHEHHAGAAPAPGADFEFSSRSSSQEAGGLSFTVAEQTSRLNRYLIKLICTCREDGCEVVLSYDERLFRKDDAERIVGYFSRLLDAVTLDPTVSVATREILDAEERRRLVADFNRTDVDYPREATIHELFEAQVRRTPERTALAFQGRHLTYAELNSRANRLAHHLRARGVGRGTPVGLCMDRSDEMIVALLGIVKAGGAYLPLHSELPRARLAYQIEEARAPFVITQEHLVGHLPDDRAEVICIDRDATQWAGESADDPERATTSDDLVYVIYTSGSTGVPKGVAVRHRNLVNYATFIARKLGADGAGDAMHYATVSTLSADLGNTCVFPALISGGCLHVIAYETAMDGATFAGYVKRHPIDVLKITPSHLNALLAGPDPGGVLPRQYLVLGGEAASWDLVRRVREMGPCRVLNHYGPTETTVGSLTFSTWDASAASSATVPIGRPIANTVAYVFDSHGQLAPLGAPGELCIGGVGVALGYLSKPEQTAERFARDHFSGDPEARFYRTGDRVRYLRDGSLAFLGRMDEQVKIRGFRVEPAEVAGVLEKHPTVAQAVVIAQDDKSSEKRLIAYIVAARGAKPTSEELRHYLLDQLPDYMVPSAFVPLDALPLTPNGKLDRRALPDPEQTRLTGAAAYVAPRNPTEERLAAIWVEVLAVERVGATDDFFELGGHSLMATQVISRVRSSFQVDLPLRSLFEAPTVAGLAQAIDECQPQAADEEVDRVLAELEGLSDDEIQRLLALEMQGEGS
jgi:amino acid adenylation domain-containing protein